MTVEEHIEKISTILNRDRERPFTVEDCFEFMKADDEFVAEHGVEYSCCEAFAVAVPLPLRAEFEEIYYKQNKELK